MMISLRVTVKIVCREKFKSLKVIQINSSLLKDHLMMKYYCKAKK